LQVRSPINGIRDLTGESLEYIESIVAVGVLSIDGMGLAPAKSTATKS